MGKKKRPLSVANSLLFLSYLLCSRFAAVPEFLLGLLLGLALASLVLSLLPETVLTCLREWKHRGQ